MIEILTVEMGSHTEGIFQNHPAAEYCRDMSEDFGKSYIRVHTLPVGCLIAVLRNGIRTSYVTEADSVNLEEFVKTHLIQDHLEPSERNVVLCNYGFRTPEGLSVDRRYKYKGECVVAEVKIIQDSRRHYRHKVRIEILRGRDLCCPRMFWPVRFNNALQAHDWIIDRCLFAFSGGPRFFVWPAD